MKDLQLLGIILCVLTNLDFVDCACTLPFGSGTYISNSRGTWTTTNTTIQNFKVTIGSRTSTVTLTCSSQYDTNRYILTTNYEILNNIFINMYTCLDIRNSSYSDKYYFYEATALDANSGDYFSADQSDVCNRATYETAIETRVVIKQGTADTNKIYCPNIILGNYTYNTTDDYSDIHSCNDTQQLTFKKNKAAYVALSSGGNLKCMYSGTGTYVYLITFNNDTIVDSSNTYQFTCFAFSFSGYGSLVYASQRPQSCSSSQTPTNANSTSGKTFIFSPYVTCPFNETTDNRASEDLGWLGGLVAVIVILIIAGTVIVYFYLKSNKVSHKEPLHQLDTTEWKPRDLKGGKTVAKKRKGKVSEREQDGSIVVTAQKKQGWRRRIQSRQIRDDTGKSLSSREHLAMALNLLRQRLSKPKRLRPRREQMKVRLGTPSSNSIYLPNGYTAEKEEKEQNHGLHSQDGQTHLVSPKSEETAEREQTMNKKILKSIHTDTVFDVIRLTFLSSFSLSLFNIRRSTVSVEFRVTCMGEIVAMQTTHPENVRPVEILLAIISDKSIERIKNMTEKLLESEDLVSATGNVSTNLKRILQESPSPPEIRKGIFKALFDSCKSDLFGTLQSGEHSDDILRSSLQYILEIDDMSARATLLNIVGAKVKTKFEN